MLETGIRTRQNGTSLGLEKPALGIVRRPAEMNLPVRRTSSPSYKLRMVSSILPVALASRNLPRMSSFKRINDSETISLPAEMQELARLIDAMQGPEKRALLTAYERVAESILRRRRILNLVQEALSQLRLDVKYLMFDLESTRRERDQFQSQLEEYDGGF